MPVVYCGLDAALCSARTGDDEKLPHMMTMRCTRCGVRAPGCVMGGLESVSSLLSQQLFCLPSLGKRDADAVQRANGCRML